MENQYRFVDYEKYCEKCQYFSLDDFRDPCNACMDESARVDTEKPINFKEKE